MRTIETMPQAIPNMVRKVRSLCAQRVVMTSFTRSRKIIKAQRNRRMSVRMVRYEGTSELVQSAGGTGERLFCGDGLGGLVEPGVEGFECTLTDEGVALLLVANA